jgi:hypothetical protein
MAQDHLLLPRATAPTLVSVRRPHWVRRIVIVLGVLAVLIGGADMLARLSQRVLGCEANGTVFGPAIGAIDPGATGQAGAAEGCK